MRTEETKIILNDGKINLTEDLKGFKPVSLLKGHLVIKDAETGEITTDQDNLILMRGRTFALEKIFDIVSDFNNEYNRTGMAQKKICLFKVGKGGCVDGEPFNVKAVIDPTETDLYDPIPFRFQLDGAETLTQYADMKSYVANDNKRYNAYYCKKFDNVEWVYNSTSNDEVAVKLTLSISQDDFKTVVRTDENNLTDFVRSTFINEIGLCIANVNPSTGEINQSTIELVTKLCFASEVYFNPLKSSILEYYIYA